MDVHKFNTKVNLMICLVYEMLLLNVCPSQSFNKHKKYILTFEYLKSNYYVKNLSLKIIFLVHNDKLHLIWPSLV